MHGELCCGAGEEALADVADELVLRFVLCGGGVVDVGPGGLFAVDEAFLGHDLEELEDRGVAEGAGGIDLLIEVADGGGTAVPEDAEEFELAFGWPWEWVVALHDLEHIRRCS